MPIYRVAVRSKTLQIFDKLGLERTERIELSSKRWQRLAIAIIRRPHYLIIYLYTMFVNLADE